MATYLGRFLILAKLASEWTAANPVLMNGELGVSDPGGASPILKVGDGVRPWSALPAIQGGGGGSAQDYVVGTTTTLAPGSFATVSIDNSVAPPTMSFGIPRGDNGPANVLSIGTVTTGAPGSSASATITGAAPAQTLNLVIPQGPPGPQGNDGADGATGVAGPAGPSNVLTIGTVTTGAPGSAADASITGPSPAQVLNLTIPTGAQGPQGIQGIQGPEGPQGPSGDASGIVTGDTHVTGEWYFDPTTWFGHTAAEIAAVKANAAHYVNDADESAHFKGRIRMERAGTEVAFLMTRVNGTLVAPTGLLAGQAIAIQYWRGAYDALGGTFNAARIEVQAINNWSATDAGATIQLQVTPVGATNVVNVAQFRGDRVESIKPLFAGYTFAEVASIVAATGVAAFDPTDAAHFNTRLHVERLASGVPIYLRRWNGTYAAPTAIVNGDTLGAIHFGGTTGAATAAQVGASVVVSAVDNWTSTNSPAALSIYCTPVGSTTGAAVITFASSGITFNAPVQGAYSAVWTAGSHSWGVSPTRRFSINAVNGIVLHRYDDNGLNFPMTYANGGITGSSQGIGIKFTYGADATNFFAAGSLQMRTLGDYGSVGNRNTSFHIVCALNGVDTEYASFNYTGINLFNSTVVSSAIGRVLDVASSVANGPYMTFVRSGTALADIGTPAQVTPGGPTDGVAIGTRGTAGIIFAPNSVEGMRVIGNGGGLQITGSIVGGMRPAPGLELGVSGGTIVVGIAYNRATSAYLPFQMNCSYMEISGPAGHSLKLGGRYALHDSNDGWLRINNTPDYGNGVYSPGIGRFDGGFLSDNGLGSLSGANIIRPNSGQISYGTMWVQGTVGGYHGIAVHDGGLRPVFMSNNTDGVGIYVSGESKWLINRNSSTAAYTVYNFTAPSFQVTSARALKRETGKPAGVRDILKRLRPIFYRLLADENAGEQLGLIAEEVHEVCPQISDGKTVMYDRLALLLLADWQESHAS